MSANATVSTDASAVVSTVPVASRGKVLTRGNELIAAGLFTLQLLLALGGGVGVAVITVLLGFRFMPDSFAPVVVGLALGGLLGWLLMGQLLRHPWSARYMFAKTQSEFLRRPDPIVDPNNPDAILVEVIPRRNWGKMGLGTTEDQGFLLVDVANGRLLFEGDQKRYQIPARALISVEVENATPSSEYDHRAAPVGVVVVTFRDREGLGDREVPFCPRRTVAGDPLGNNYMEKAHELLRRIQTLLAAHLGAV